MRNDLTRLVIDAGRRRGWVLTTPELLHLGAAKRHVTSLVSAGVLIRRHPATYIVAGAPADPVIEIRAALAATRRSRGAGGPAIASHFTAGWLQGLVDASPRRVELTMSDARRNLDGVTVHRSLPLPDSRPVRGLPCTVPARTLVDLASRMSPAGLETAVDRALDGRLLRLSDLRRLTDRRGSALLRQVLRRRGDVDAPAPSVLESRMARLMHAAGLRGARAEHRAGPDGRYRIDFAFPEKKVAVEVYGYTWHHSPEQMERDLARQRQLTLQGWTVLAYTWQEVMYEPERVVAQIRAALGA